MTETQFNRNGMFRKTASGSKTLQKTRNLLRSKSADFSPARDEVVRCL
jgi:hypothetical protein